jgi:UDPglucose--hexose-1-phosphate uridylyltransferase
MAGGLVDTLPHRRYNALSGEYVLVSPQRASRPWQGQVEHSSTAELPSYSPDCYLCPGNSRAHGQVNPNYSETFVFGNDFPALLKSKHADKREQGFFQRQEVSGTNRVICYSPRHDLTLARMNREQLASVVMAWCDQTAELGEEFAWVQIFQNQGEMMGASNEHPHGQVWATDFIPEEAGREDEQQRQHLSAHTEPLLPAYLREELENGERLVLQNQHWVALVPFWAVWPFEILLMPRRHILRLPDLNDEERESLAEIVRVLMIRYDNLFNCPFPYSMGWHGAPFGKGSWEHWQLHAHFYPPLLRSASVRKFMVGYEMLAEAQRDITAEQAAAKLAALPDVRCAP